MKSITILIMMLAAWIGYASAETVTLTVQQESVKVNKAGTVTFSDKNNLHCQFAKEHGMKQISETKFHAAIIYNAAFSHKTGLLESKGKIFNYTDSPIIFNIRGYQGTRQICSRTITVKPRTFGRIFDDDQMELAKTCDRIVCID